jgi:hypothetical protein
VVSQRQRGAYANSADRIKPGVAPTREGIRLRPEPWLRFVEPFSRACGEALMVKLRTLMTGVASPRAVGQPLKFPATNH